VTDTTGTALGRTIPSIVLVVGLPVDESERVRSEWRVPSIPRGVGLTGLPDRRDPAVNTDVLDLLDLHGHGLRMAAEAVDTANVGLEQFVRMLTVEVGHTDSTVVYEENKLELHRYDPDQRRHATPIVIVYALVNRPYILDLQPDRSVIRRLLQAGFVVYLIDWGEPSRLDSSLTMDDYVSRYVDNCIDVVREAESVPDVHLLGYCMGGTMSIAYTATRPDPVRTLSLMATPFAFEGDGGILEHWAGHYDPDSTVEVLGNVPAELLAVEFSMMDPVDSYLGKYVRLYENIEDDEFVENFARMERWIWDGVDVSGATYREFLDDIYRENRLADGAYELGEDPVDVSTIEVPVQQIVGQYDHIVPPESSAPFNEQIASTDERIVEFSAGHIGISVSTSAHERLWPDVCEWFAERSLSPPQRETSQRTRPQPGAIEGQTGGEEPLERADVETIDGIGPTYAGRLREAGIETVADLREYDAKLLAAVADTTPARAENWLE